MILIVKGYGEKSVPKCFQWNIWLIDNSIDHLFRFYLELIFLLLIVCKVLREFLCLPHLSSRDMLKGPEKKQKFDLITCQSNCLASVLKQSWTDRFHKENEESLYRSSEFHYLLEFHLKDHKFCNFFHYFKSYEKGHVYCNNKNSDRVLESHPLIKKEKVHKFKWMLFPHEGFASGWNVLQILWVMMLDWGWCLSARWCCC